jgi:hypothetical protein
MSLRFCFLALSAAILIAMFPGCLVNASEFFHISANTNVEIVAVSEESEHKMLVDTAPSELVYSAPIDLDGVVFETVVADREWVIPPNEPSMYTPIKFGIRVTNNTQEPIRIALANSLSAWLAELDGSGRAYQRFSLPYTQLSESDYPLLEPRESISVFLDGRLLWSNTGQLIALGTDGYNVEWVFGELYRGSFQLWIAYSGSREIQNSVDFGRFLTELWQVPPHPLHKILVPVRVFEDPESLTGVEMLEGVVGNSVQVPPVEIRLVSHQ